MSDRQPHPNSTGWTLEISESELDRVLAMTAAVSWKRERGQYLSVGVVDCTTRRWVFEGAHATTWVSAPCGPCDPQDPERLPRQFIEAALPLADSLGSVLIYRDRTTGQFVAVTGTDMIACDPWDDGTGEYDDLESMCDPVEATVSATVSLETVRRMSNDFSAYFDMAIGRSSHTPPAFTGLTVTDGRISWISDWGRWGMPKQSGSAAAETKGAGSVGFLADVMMRASHVLPHEGTATISWNGECPLDVWMIGDDWGVHSEVHHELMFRHHREIHSGFSVADFDTDVSAELDSQFAGRIGPCGYYIKKGRRVVVTVHDPGADFADFARLTTHVATAEVGLPAVRAEIDRVSESLVGSKLIVQDNEIYLAVEFPIGSGHEVYPRHIELLESNLAKCEGLGEFLPLFSQG